MKDKLVQIRVSEEELARLKALAGDVPLSRYIIKRVLETEHTVTGAVPEYRHAGGHDQGPILNDSHRQTMNPAMVEFLHRQGRLGKTGGKVTRLEYEAGYEPEEEPVF